MATETYALWGITLAALSAWYLWQVHNLSTQRQLLVDYILAGRRVDPETAAKVQTIIKEVTRL